MVLNVEERHQVKIRADADRVIQILDNLLNNAIRHAPADSTVNIRIQKDEKEVLCEINDRGAGIPAQDLPYIFEQAKLICKKIHEKNNSIITNCIYLQ